jgi:hypothetical protein
MKVTVPASFTLQVDYDEAYMLHAALRAMDVDSLSPVGQQSRRDILNQLHGLISLASGADATCVPFRAPVN